MTYHSIIPPLPSDIFRPGQVLNNTYEIEGAIGRGGLGEVYRARNLVSKRVVAIKGLPRQFADDERYVELMRREERIRDIRHEAVVRYTECARTDEGHVFIVMDFIDGPSLRDELKKRRVSASDLLAIANRVADGLRAAHDRGIIHRDLSPDNIILRDGQPEGATVIDFGIAKDTASREETIVGNGFAGKFGYAAPEQFEGRVDARSDLYALGASLLAAFRGETPLTGLTMVEVMQRKRQPLETGDVPEPLKSLIDRLTAPDPDARPASAAETTTLILELSTGGPAPSTARPPATDSPTIVAGRHDSTSIGNSSDDSQPQPRSDRVGRQKWGRKADLVSIAAALMIAGAVAGLWQMGHLDWILPRTLPTADPYRLEASCVSVSDNMNIHDSDPCTARLEGHAPNSEAAARLVRAVSSAGGALPGESSLTLAQGIPNEGWVTAMEDLIEIAGDLETWTIEAEDLAVRITGIAKNGSEREAALVHLTERARSAGLSPDLTILTGPRLLARDVVLNSLARVATCGPLSLAGSPDAGYTLGATVRIQGMIAYSEDRELIRHAVAEVAGDRAVDLSRTNVLEPHLCDIHQALPPVTDDSMEIILSDGGSGRENPTGVFETGDEIGVDLELPAHFESRALWVFMVTGSNVVFHLLPTIRSPEQRVEQLGSLQGEIRYIPILPRIVEDNKMEVFEVAESDLGKGQIIALLSDEPLLELRPSMGESIASLSETLLPVLRERPNSLISVAIRDFEARMPR